MCVCLLWKILNHTNGCYYNCIITLRFSGCAVINYEPIPTVSLWFFSACSISSAEVPIPAARQQLRSVVSSCAGSCICLCVCVEVSPAVFQHFHFYPKTPVLCISFISKMCLLMSSLPSNHTPCLSFKNVNLSRNLVQSLSECLNTWKCLPHGHSQTQGMCQPA